jgi:hypothetical protein
LLIGALLAMAFPASAMTASSAAPDSPTNLPRSITAAPPAVPAGQTRLLSYRATRYGYTGTFRDDTQITDADWYKADHRFGSGRLESFGIAPDGTIWHAWPGSGGWKEMPGHGRADNTAGYKWSYPSRTAKVWVTGSGLWCNTDSGNGWGGWYTGPAPYPGAAHVC